MRFFLTILLATMALGAVPAMAQTPDGETPAVETVCDQLQADGITKGLYGLCVAFCEAQDITDEDEPITAEELQTLEMSTPSGRILANYNKKRDRAANPLDPEMPCILVEAPCPCWTPEELSKVGDGLNIDGTTAAGRTHCSTFDQAQPNAPSYPGFVDRQYIDDFTSGTNWEQEYAIVDDWDADTGIGPTGLQRCAYGKAARAGPRENRSLSIQQGTLTATEHASCTAALNAHMAAVRTAGTCTSFDDRP